VVQRSRLPLWLRRIVAVVVGVGLLVPPLLLAQAPEATFAELKL
jgi:hypothetical protein